MVKRRWLFSPILLALTLTSWSLGSPIGSSSDDDYHLTSIWCAQGAHDGRCEYQGKKGRVQVPLPIAQAGICYLGDNEKSASCTNEELRFSSKTLIEAPRILPSDRVSLFYWMNGLLVTSNIELSILTMRFMNIALLLVLLWLVRRSADDAAFNSFNLVMITTSVPGALFIVTSNNSSSWTFLGLGFAWMFAYQFVVEPLESRRFFAIGGLVLCGTLGIGSRSESAVFLVIQVIGVSTLAVLNIKGDLVRRRAITVSAVTTAVGGIFYLSSNARRLVENGFLAGDDESPIVRVPRHVLFSNLLSVSELYTGLLGGLKGIGASTTELTGTVRTLTTFVLGFIMIASLRRISRVSAAYLVILTAVLVVVPLYILQKNLLFVGEELVPRYLYPFLVLLVGSMVLISDSRQLLSKHQAIIVSVALGIAHAISLRLNILRHTHGIDQYGVFNLDSGREWWWTFDSRLHPMAAFGAGVVGFTLLLFRTTGQLSLANNLRSSFLPQPE